MNPFFDCLGHIPGLLWSEPIFAQSISDVKRKLLRGEPLPFGVKLLQPSLLLSPFRRDLARAVGVAVDIRIGLGKLQFPQSLFQAGYLLLDRLQPPLDHSALAIAQVPLLRFPPFFFPPEPARRRCGAPLEVWPNPRHWPPLE